MEKYLRNFTEVAPTRMPLLTLQPGPLCITHESIYITQWFFFSVLKENFQFSFFLLYSFFTLPSFLKPCSLGIDLFDHAVAFNRLSDLKII